MITVIEVKMPKFFSGKEPKTKAVVINPDHIKKIERYQPYQPSVKVTFIDGKSMIVSGDASQFSNTKK